jgi:hypothetical protein
MSATLVKKSKWFWAWQDDKEEAWLREMARQGLHLKQLQVFGSYTFVQGEPQEVAYCLDFVTQPKKDESYFQLFKDAGWEHVGEMGGWQYWRKPAQDGKMPEIFTDPASKVQKYQRLLGFLAIFVPIFMINLINYNNHITRYDSSFLSGLMAGIYFTLFVIYGILAFCMLMLLRRISELKKNKV